MGAWGPKLYQDDIAEEVKDYYKDQLHRGKTGKEITQELIKQNEYAISDPDDAPVFWFALADTQWTLGRLEDFVKEMALHYISEGNDVKRWELESPKEAKIRAKVLFDLKQKLLSPQPAEKKISKYNLYQCEWKLGDVYAYPLESDYAKKKGIYGRCFLFHKIDECVWHPGHIVPIVRIKITDGDQFPIDENTFNKLEYVQTSATNYEDRFLPFDARYSIDDQIAERSKIKYEVDEFGLLPEYRIVLINTSKRVIPKNIVFIGNFKNISPPKIEFIPHSDLSLPSIMWNDIDKILIDRYCGYNLRKFEAYSDKNFV